MTDKELIRRALMGSQEAQRACTDKGVALPCPKCFKEIKVTSYCRRYYFVCDDCLIQFISALDESKSDAISRWNTRPAPPIGRCGECKYFNHFFNAVGHCMIHSQEKDSFGDGYRVEMLKTDFCSYFEPKER